MKRTVATILAVLCGILVLGTCNLISLSDGEGEIRFDLGLVQPLQLGYEVTRVRCALQHQVSGTVVERDLQIEGETAAGLIRGLRIGWWDILIELLEGDDVVGSAASEVEVRNGETARLVLQIELSTGDVEVVANWKNGGLILEFDLSELAAAEYSVAHVDYLLTHHASGHTVMGSAEPLEDAVYVEIPELWIGTWNLDVEFWGSDPEDPICRTDFDLDINPSEVPTLRLTTEIDPLPEVQLVRPSPDDVQAYGWPDLVVTDLAAPAAAGPGESIGSEIDLVVANEGVGVFPADATDGTVTVSFYLSERSYHGPLSVHLADVDLSTPIGASDTVSVDVPPDLSIPESTLDGDYYLLVLVDTDNEVAELFENNNSHSSRKIEVVWDWTLDRLHSMYWKGMDEPEDPVLVRLPWYETRGPHYEVLNRNGNPDILPEDGWVIFDRDFGREGDPDNPMLPFVMLYNRRTGVLRAFIYNGTRGHGDQNTTYTMGKLGIDCGGDPIGSFTIHTGTTLEDLDPDYKQAFIAEGLVEDTWTYLDFDVTGYHADLEDPQYRNSLYVLDLYGLTESQLQVTGTLSLSGFITADGVRTGYTGDGELDQFLGEVIEGSETLIKPFLSSAKVFKNLSSGLEKMLEYSGENEEKWWSNPLRQIAEAGTDAFLPGFGAVAGFITGLATGGEDKTIPLRWRIEQTGAIELSGTIQTLEPIASFYHYVSGTSHDTGARQPLYDSPLGILNLRSRPVIERRVVRVGYEDDRYMGLSLGQPLEIDVSEHCGFRLESTQLALVGPDFEPSDFYDEAELLDFNELQPDPYQDPHFDPHGVLHDEWGGEEPYQVGIKFVLVPDVPEGSAGDEMAIFCTFNARYFLVQEQYGWGETHRLEYPLF